MTYYQTRLMVYTIYIYMKEHIPNNTNEPTQPVGPESKSKRDFLGKLARFFTVIPAVTLSDLAPAAVVGSGFPLSAFTDYDTSVAEKDIERTLSKLQDQYPKAVKNTVYLESRKKDIFMNSLNLVELSQDDFVQKMIEYGLYNKNVKPGETLERDNDEVRAYTALYFFAKRISYFLIKKYDLSHIPHIEKMFSIPMILKYCSDIKWENPKNLDDFHTKIKHYDPLFSPDHSFAYQAINNCDRYLGTYSAEKIESNDDIADLFSPRKYRSLIEVLDKTELWKNISLESFLSHSLESYADIINIAYPSLEKSPEHSHIWKIHILQEYLDQCLSLEEINSVKKILVNKTMLLIANQFKLLQEASRYSNNTIYPGGKGDCSTFIYCMVKKLYPVLPNSVYYGDGYEQVTAYAEKCRQPVCITLKSINENPGIYIASNGHHMEMLIYDYAKKCYTSIEYHIHNDTVEILDHPNPMTEYIITESELDIKAVKIF
jgi:hypothetical protein